MENSKAAGNKNRRKSNLDGDTVDDDGNDDESMLDLYHQNISADIDRLAHEFSTLYEKGIQPEIPDTVDTFLRIIELRIKRYNSTKSGMRFGKMMTDQEEPFFTDAIKRLSKLKTALTEFPNSTPSLDRITNVLQQTMTLMQDELQALLLDYSASSEPITVCKKPNSDSTYCEGTNNLEQEFPGYSNENMILMRKIASLMIAAGYQSESCNVYATVRKDGLHEQVKRFGFEKVNIEDVHKSKWASLEPDISRCVGLANHCSDVVIPCERKLGETVFSDHLSVFTGELFMNLIHSVTTLLVEFATAVAMTKPKAKRLFKFLDIYKALGNVGASIDTHVTLEDQICNLKSEISSVIHIMGETVVNTFKDINNYIRNDTNKTPVQGGAIHPLTRYIINYLKSAFDDDYHDTLENIFQQHVVNEDEPNSSDLEDESSSSSSSTLSKQLFSVIELLDANLETKSGLYKDQSLRCIFLMNNNRFILQVVKASKEMKEAMGDNWCRRKSSDVRNYHKSYQRETWNRLLQCITQEGVQVNGKPNRRIVKEKLKSFNGMFDEIYKTQSTWVVNDDQLLSEIRVSITAVVSPAYRSFIGRYKPQFEGAKSIDKYIKYQPEDIEAMMETLFEGTEKVESQMNGIQAASTVKQTAGAFKSLLKTYKNVGLL